MSDQDGDAAAVAELLKAMEQGDEKALGRLVTLIYPELKRLAHFQLAREQPGHALNTTAIVHEAFERLAAGSNRWNDRNHFLRAAAKVMRHLLVDHARRRNAEKRGSGEAAVTLQDDLHAADDDGVAVLSLDRALEEIAGIDPRLEQIVECRYFAGLTVQETADALDMSVRSVERDWQRARGYLITALGTDTD